jgi:TonB-linked SusC/RagA family outer membrane protein
MSNRPFLRKVPWLWFAMLPLLFTHVFAQAQTKGVQNLQITGTVKTALTRGLERVTVHNLNSGKSTVTDDAGGYTIMAKQGDSLAFSHVGYNTQTFYISDRIVINVTMDALAGSLDDVVVVGYGQQKKISLVGAQASVNVENLQQPVANLSSALAGQVAGLVTNQPTGLPGQNATGLLIRGIATMTSGGNDPTPLIIIDGVQGRDIDAFDPADIASFTILKDASSTAVYGAAGANGVILIQTKRGKPGKTQISFNVASGFNTFTQVPQLANGVQYMTLRDEAEANSGYTPEYSQAYIDSTVAGHQPYLYPDVNWRTALFNNSAETRRVNFSVRGGTDNVTYYASLAYYDEKSLLKTDGLQAYNADTRFRRYNFTSNVGMNWTKTTRFELGLQGYISNTNYPYISPNQAFSDVMETNPVLYPTIYPGDTIPSISSAGAQPDPYAELTQSGYQNIFSNQLYSNARLSQDFSMLIKGLSAYTMYSFDNWNSETITMSQSRSTYYINQSAPYNPDGSLNLNLVSLGSDQLNYGSANSGNRQYYWESAINYDQTFNRKNHVTGLLLYNERSYINAFAGDLTSSLPYKSEGLAGRATYSWSDRYFGEVNFGYNGSENFAPNNRFGFFPSLGLGWVVSSEPFFEPFKNTVQFLKFRYSNGYVGDGGTSYNSGTRRFGYLTLVQEGTNGYQFGTGQYTTGYSGISITDYGSNVSWAKSHKQDWGMEFKTFHNHLSVVADVFTEMRTGIFLQRASLADYAGFINDPWANLGQMSNKGFDGTLEINPIKLGQVYISGRFIYSYSRNKVIQNDQPNPPYPYMSQKGVPANSDYGLIALGLFKSQADVANSPDQSAIGTPTVGDIKYKDLNGDGKIDQNDVTRIGNGAQQTSTYGFGLNASWRQWSVSAFFQGIGGSERQLGGDGIIPFANSTGPDRGNLYSVAMNRWTPEHPNGNFFYPRLEYGSAQNANNDYPSTWWEKNIDYLRFKTANLTYTFPKSAMKHIFLKGMRIYAEGENLFLWSKFKLWDPELSTANGNLYPISRTVTFGIQADL